MQSKGWRLLRTKEHHRCLHLLVGISNGLEGWRRFHDAPKEGMDPGVKGQHEQK